MDTEYWLDFHLGKSLVCSKCGVGNLYRKGKFQQQETLSSRLRTLEEIIEYDREFKFSGFLECDNPHCMELFSLQGQMEIQPDVPIFDEYQNIVGTPMRECYTPEYISPPLNIIELKNEYPTTVKAALYDSFKLFFADNEACANKIRTSVELLLDERGIENKKGIRLNDRIAKFKVIDPTNGKLLEAVKWIGNYGSHQDKIIRKDVLDGYEFLKAVLDNLYDNESEKLKLKAEQINSQNKPISKIGK